jgi:hypothetical protein
MSLKSIVEKLADQARWNENKAYAILGAHPGPGFDLMIRPKEPICGRWFVEGLTQCGKGFIDRFWSEQPLSNQRVAEMRKQALEWGLTFYTTYRTLSLAEIETSLEK